MRLTRRLWLLVGLGALIGVLVLTLVSAVGAQTPDETPAATAPTQTTGGTPTPGPEVRTLVKITVDPTLEQPIKKGTEFEAHVLVDDVEHMAGFDFSITYDPKRIEPVYTSESDQNATGGAGTPVGSSERPVKTANLGQFLLSSGRDQGELLCSDARVQGSSALVTCSLLGAPVCAGGQPGVSGSGELGAIVFKSKGGGVTTLELSKSDLVADDIAPPCDITEEGDIKVVPIPHRSQGITIELAKNSSSNGALIVVIAVVVVAVVVAGGGAGYVVYRRRQGGRAA